LRIHAVGGVGPLARRPGPVQDRRAPIAGAADAVPFRWPAVGGGRVLSADHAPQTPQAPSEDVSAATHPSTVFAREGTTARVAVRDRLLPPRRQLLRRVSAPLLSAGVSRDRGLPPRWRANGALASPRNGKGRSWALRVAGRAVAASAPGRPAEVAPRRDWHIRARSASRECPRRPSPQQDDRRHGGDEQRAECIGVHEDRFSAALAPRPATVAR
jgi:hypothetical protein